MPAHWSGQPEQAPPPPACLLDAPYPGTTPREQRSLMACTSYRSSVFRRISAETLATPWVTVLWLRPPSRRPTSVNARPISCTRRYIATCLGTDMARLRLALTRSSTLRPKWLATSDRMRCDSILSLATVAPDWSTGNSPFRFTTRFLRELDPLYGRSSPIPGLTGPGRCSLRLVSWAGNLR